MGTTGLFWRWDKANLRWITSEDISDVITHRKTLIFLPIALQDPAKDPSMALENWGIGVSWRNRWGDGSYMDIWHYDIWVWILDMGPISKCLFNVFLGCSLSCYPVCRSSCWLSESLVSQDPNSHPRSRSLDNWISQKETLGTTLGAYLILGSSLPL